MKIERFKDIDAWQLARELILQTAEGYRLTEKPGLAKDYEQARRIRTVSLVDSSNISKNMKRASQQTVNCEP